MNSKYRFPRRKWGSTKSIVEQTRAGNLRAFAKYIASKRLEITVLCNEHRIPIMEVIEQLRKNMTGSSIRAPTSAASVALAVQKVIGRRSAKKRQLEMQIGLKAKGAVAKSSLTEFEKRDTKERMISLVSELLQKSKSKNAQRNTLIFMDYYFGNHTLRQLARKYGIVTSRAGQIINWLEAKLKQNREFLRLANELREER